ncbi:hypothetical protein BGX21_008236 [Mortierella sp. AD011]|nr:hypothetical protein BGX20_008361 [Mortierella sp. AD010]KAF9398035.1 hypothetical protein BGX21_008236 [Mortierella sp. AD011]
MLPIHRILTNTARPAVSRAMRMSKLPISSPNSTFAKAFTTSQISRQETFRIKPSVAPGSSTGKDTPLLFQPFSVKDLTIANRLVVAPMCMYSSKDGYMTDFHLVHLGSFAINGAGLVLAEATAVDPRGRISPADAGIWSDDHIPAIKRVADFVHSQGSKFGIQLAHAGRKASVNAPYDPEAFSETEYWRDDVVGPSGGPESRWDERHAVPRALAVSEIQDVVKAFGAAAARAAKAGADTVEIQSVHGYLIHQFLSPVSNQRTDQYGGSLENRARLMLEVIKEVRANFPAEKPIFMRISGSDCVEHLDIRSWDIEQTVQVSKWAKEAGVDVLHLSSAGNTPLQKVAYAPGYQVHYAERVRKEVPGLPVIAVGSITGGKQAQEILESGKADLIAGARIFLKQPSFVLEAARELVVEVAYAPQYSLAKTL